MIGATTISFAPSSNISLSFGIPPFTPISSVTVPAGGECLGLWVKGLAAGAATITITSPGYTPRTVGFFVSP
jgi:uncharacterized membrane protein